MLTSLYVLDNRQFQVTLAFTGLNVVVAVILAMVRKRSGLFGLTPKRKEGNEFMEAKDGHGEAAAPNQETSGKQLPKVATICRQDDNASSCLKT
jgi:hypothetical protein